MSDKIGDSVLSPEVKESDRVSKGGSKKSRTTSCERCKRRKQKCDHRLPRCTNCLKAGAECVQPEKYVQHAPTRYEQDERSELRVRAEPGRRRHNRAGRHTNRSSDDYTTVLEAKVAQLEEKLMMLQSSNGVKIEGGGGGGGSGGGGTSVGRHTSTSSLGGRSPLSGNNSTSNASPVNSSSVVVGSPVGGIGGSGGGGGGRSGSASGSVGGGGTGMRRRGTTVSILNVDPENEGVAPQSFTVVSSLLQETYWGQNKTDDIGGPLNSSENSGTVSNMNNNTANTSPNVASGTVSRVESPKEGSIETLMDVDRVVGGSVGGSVGGVGGGSTVGGLGVGVGAGAGVGNDGMASISTSTGILPDYDFGEYLNYSPAKPPDKQIGDNLLNSFLAGSQGRFPFVDRNLLLKIHNERFDAPPTLDCPKYRFANFLLFTSYAIASVSHTPTQGENPEFEPFGYYSTALQHAKMCKSKNIIWHISTLLMCAMFQMRTDKDKGCHYDMVRKSMRICVEIGMHKGNGLENMSKYDQEICKRLFWSVYSLERLFAISTGRPFVMDEKEIEISFPCDMNDEDLLDETKIVEHEKYRDANELRPASSMTFIIYIWRLRRLESDLVQAIYRVDRSIEERFSHVDYYLNALKEWKESNRVTTPKEQNITNTAYSRDIRLLLQPFLGRLSPDSDLFQMCVRETGHICQIFRDFYRKKESGFTTMAMHTNFVAGLTLVYCLWLAKDSSILPILENVRSCTAALYVLTERSRLCMNYRDTFENLVSTTMKHIIEHRRQKRLRKELQEIEKQRILEEEREKEMERIHKEQEERRLRERMHFEIERQRLRQQHQQQQQQQHHHQQQQQQQQLIKHETNELSEIQHIAPPSSGSLSSASSTFPVIDRSPYLPTTSIVPVSTLPEVVASIPDTAASFAQAHGPGNFANTGMELQKDWIEAYGYDDTLYNMIQDISSWTKQVGDATETRVTTTTSDSAGWFNDNTTDNAWMNISDFGYS